MIALYKELIKQIILATQHDCMRYDQPCTECHEMSRSKALQFIQALPRLREVLATDVRAAMEGDPAAKSFDEVISSYPGLFAITVQRIAHELHQLKVPRLPRMMTEYAHSFTGIDIHPGARIGKSFFIDHGTGVVYSNTTILGGDTVIGARTTIGGNVWITESVPPDTRVYLKKPELLYSGNGHKRTDKERRKMIAQLDADRITGAGC